MDFHKKILLTKEFLELIKSILCDTSSEYLQIYLIVFKENI